MIVEYDDNITKNFQDWSAPYRFIIVRKSKLSNKVELMLWTPTPELAYKAYVTVKESALIAGGPYDYYLHDSWHIDAESFCRTAYENADEIPDF